MFVIGTLFPDLPRVDASCFPTVQGSVASSVHLRTLLSVVKLCARLYFSLGNGYYWLYIVNVVRTGRSVGLSCSRVAGCMIFGRARDGLAGLNKNLAFTTNRYDDDDDGLRVMAGPSGSLTS